MGLANRLDSLRQYLFPPDYKSWLAKSRAYGERLRQGGSPHASRWQELDRLTAAPYVKTFDFPGDYINDTHRGFGQAPLGYRGVAVCGDFGIDGLLRREDALKIYELAYFTKGNVLELGTYHGLSTGIIAQALEHRSAGSLETVDLDPAHTAAARANLASRPGYSRITFTTADATVRLDELIRQGARYGFIFIDHWHGYDATVQAAERARVLLSPGGYILFHDYLDAANYDRRHVYGVYQAVLDTIADDPNFAFDGTSGSCGIFRHQPPRSAS